MGQFKMNLRPTFLAAAIALPAGLLATAEAQAHVKWFCAFDVAGQPRGLEQVLCADFEWLVAVALACLMAGSLAEGTPLGTALLNALDRVTSRLRTETTLLVRAALVSVRKHFGGGIGILSWRQCPGPEEEALG